MMHVHILYMYVRVHVHEHGVVFMVGFKIWWGFVMYPILFYIMQTHMWTTYDTVAKWTMTYLDMPVALVQISG